jgi:hypothetical protein
LEKDVEELTRSRDEARQSAVQEAAQYVEIVRKATQLEIMAAEERKAWDRLKAEMEERIEVLMDKDRLSSSRMEINEEPCTTDLPSRDPMEASRLSLDTIQVKDEPTSPTAPRQIRGALISGNATDSNNALKSEITRLRARCVEVEDALRTGREESRSLQRIVEALGLAGRSILEKADQALDGITPAD